MAQLAIYLDEATAIKLEEAATREGLSRSAWVRRAVRERLRNRLPDSFFEVLGAWDDRREPSEILTDLRQEAAQLEREPLK